MTPPRVTVLGTGAMGAGMARSLLRAGLTTTVWNRDQAKAEALAEAGAQVASTVDQALLAADVVITMLFDAASVFAVLQPSLAGGTFPSSAVWLQCSTTGIAGTAQLAELATLSGVVFVDAPVLGTKQPAEDGNLVVLCSGPEHARDRVAPVTDAIGSRTLWVGDHPGQASGLKLVCNAWVTTINNAVAQSISLAQAVGLDPELFLAAIDSGPVNAPFAQFKGKLMIEGRTETAAFALDGALKDAELIGAAMREAGVDGTLMAAVSSQIRAASNAGYGHHDMAAVVQAFR